MNCYSIPPEKPFFPTLARWVMETYGKGPLGLTSVRILLPGRRACRSLQEAFLAESGGKPLLLPRIEPLGEMDMLGLVDAPPVISPLRRQLLLMKLISTYEGRRQGRVFNMEKAAELAAELARFMDEVAREELDYADLQKLAPGELNAHWQQTVEFLKIISQYWPELLEAEGVSDPVEYRNQCILHQADEWKNNEPDYPVIAAGSTGSQPATAHLLSVIAGMKQGWVILPGLDTGMEKQEWDVIAETHPQYLLKQLIETLGIKRDNVQQLTGEAKDTATAVCIRHVFAPASMTAHWKEADIPLAKGFSHIRLIESESELEEARHIAVLLREALDTPEKTAALITPDRALARLVAAQMQRYGIAIDDSAGRNLNDCSAAVYMRLVAEMVDSGAAPVPLLALLRHPLTAGGKDTATCRHLSRQLEIDALRGVRLQSGLGALRDAVASSKELFDFLDAMEKAMQPLAALFENKKSVPLRRLLEEHIRFAEWLATTPKTRGRERLWAKESGNHIATWLAEMLEHADTLHEVAPFIYPAVFEALVSTQSYWPRHSAHPRLHILSPIEARLQPYDRVILGGMNESTWPATTSADPWMSRPMRQQFGLPLPERNIGQAAHDVYMTAFAPELFLTRARKVAGTPQIPSRWLVRLQTLVGGKDAALMQSLDRSDYYSAASSFIDRPQALPQLTQPAPIPPVTARPPSLSVTAIDKWLEDPYVVYARYILKLKAKDKLDREPEARDFGNRVHKALQAFTTEWPEALPDNPEAELMQCGKAEFRAWLSRPSVYSLWWPRFGALAGWFAEQENARRPLCTKVWAEIDGVWNIKVDSKPFTLTTRIDRIEERADGGMAIIDYKTGSVPKENEVLKGDKNQLALESLVASEGELKSGPKSNPMLTQEYWKLGNKAEACEIIPMKLAAENLAETRRMLEGLIRAYDKPGAAYKASEESTRPEYNDYEHLTRREEWEAV